jgi:hypothetical protein
MHLEDEPAICLLRSIPSPLEEELKYHMSIKFPINLSPILIPVLSK